MKKDMLTIAGHGFDIRNYLHIGVFLLRKWDSLSGISCIKNFSLAVLDTITMISFHLWCMPGNSACISWRATYFRWLRSKIILAPLGMPKWVWPSMNQYRVIFVKTFWMLKSHYSKHAPKVTQHGRCCMRNNHLQTESHVQDNSNF